MEAVAKLNKYPSAPRKMRLVVDTIRGVNVEKALNILKFSEKTASKPLEKLLLSAVNNWMQKNAGANIADADLYVKTVFVDGGKTLKRFQPAPMGRAYRIRKRSNHVTLIVDSRNAVDLKQAVEVAAEEVNEVAKKSKAVKVEKPAAEKKPRAKKVKTDKE
jgi:large subunit ribosomal protein L22